jgi:glycosyltransferase involved in cell wall biosynthesis
MGKDGQGDLGGTGGGGGMRIAFDASCLIGSKSGVAYYTEGLILHLAKEYGDDIELVGHYCNFLGRRKNLDLPQAPNITYRPTKLLPAQVLNLLRRLRFWIPFELLIKGRADFHLFPAFIGWPSLYKTPCAPVIYDTTYLDYPEFVNTRALHDLKAFIPRAIKRAAFVITISETSAASISYHYDIPKSEIAITHVPPLRIEKLSKDSAKTQLKELDISDPYVLFLGNLEPRKNLVTLLEAYKQLNDQVRDKLALVIAGGKGWHDQEIQNTIADMQSQNYKVILPGYVDDKQRAALFQGASAFVLPSHYEGFGMTLLEAMSYQTPVIASDIPIFHEVCGEAALYFDPGSAQALAEQIQNVNSDKKIAEQLIKSGNENLSRFSWKEVTSTIYKRIEKEVES